MTNSPCHVILNTFDFFPFYILSFDFFIDHRIVPVFLVVLLTSTDMIRVLVNETSGLKSFIREDLKL